MSDDILIQVCEAFMTTLNIKQYENKLIKQLSGGNRRKVSLAIALLGAPPTVYLDEVIILFIFNIIFRNIIIIIGIFVNNLILYL